MKKLGQKDFCGTAKTIGCEVETIQAVAKVESGGRGGFDEKGRLLLRFEGHHFRKYTNGKYDGSHSHLSYPYSHQKWKPHGYSAFNEAFALDDTAAMLACSYGMFQVLGIHFDDLGFETIGAFLDFLKKGEAEQLEIFVRFCRVNGLLDELRRNDFAGFARVYNGANYRDFNYDGQMRGYYKSLKTKKIDCSKLLATVSDAEIEQAVNHLNPISTANQETAVSELPSVNPHSPVDMAAAVEASPATTSAAETYVEAGNGEVKVQTSETNSFSPETFDAFVPQITTARTWLKRMFAGGVLGTIVSYLMNLPVHLQIALSVFVIVVAVGTIVMFVKYHKEIFAYVGLMNAEKADPTKHNPEIKSL